MVFWKTYPLCNVIGAKLNRNVFKSQRYNRESMKSPTGINAIAVTINQNYKYISEIRTFIKNNFGNPPHTPVLDIPEDKLIGENDHIIFLRDIDKNIVGCVRHHYLGKLVTSEGQDIYCIDCFTVNRIWRRLGVGDYLLTTLHIYMNENNISYSLFLKEGAPLNIIHSPFYSSVYVFRKLEYDNTPNVKSLTVDQAYKLMDLFREFNNGMFIVRNINTDNQVWKLYKKGIYKILTCFQNTYQRFEEDGMTKKICWATAWIESPNITDEIREEASKELSATMYPDFDYIWMNKEWVGNSSEWKIDGLFHWYLYQWASNVSIKRSYCILN